MEVNWPRRSKALRCLTNTDSMVVNSSTGSMYLRESDEANGVGRPAATGNHRELDLATWKIDVGQSAEMNGLMSERDTEITGQ